MLQEPLRWELGHVAARGRGCVEYQETADERELAGSDELDEGEAAQVKQERCLFGRGRSAATGLGNGADQGFLE